MVGGWKSHVSAIQIRTQKGKQVANRVTPHKMYIHTKNSDPLIANIGESACVWLGFNTGMPLWYCCSSAGIHDTSSSPLTMISSLRFEVFLAIFR